MQIKRFEQKAIDFFNKDLWQIREKEFFLPKRLWFYFLKIITMTIRSPFRGEILTHARALSYQIIFSLIPLLALIFAVAKGFGIQDKIEPILLKKTMGGEIAQNLIPKIVEYVNNTNVAALGYTGLAFILYMAIALISRIEISFNQIWSIRKPRTIFRKFSDYLSVLLLGPILLFLTLGLSTSLSSNTITQKLLEFGLLAGVMKLLIFSLPWMTSILVLTFLYIFIPNTKVQFIPSLTAGFIAGSAWHLSQIGLIHFQVGMAKYNAIYGTFATVPIFMFWIYVSWAIVLAGAIIGHACQTKNNFHPLTSKTKIHFDAREKIAFLILQTICRHFMKKEIVTNEEIATELDLPKSVVNIGLAGLVEIGYLARTVDKKAEYLPAMPVEHLRMADFFSDIKKINGRDFVLINEAAAEEADKLSEQFNLALREKFGDKNILDV